MVDYGYKWDQILEVFKIKEFTCKQYYCDAIWGPYYGQSTRWQEAEDKFLDNQRANGVTFNVIAVKIR